MLWYAMHIRKGMPTQRRRNTCEKEATQKKMQSKALAGREKSDRDREGEDRGRAYPDLIPRIQTRKP